MSSSKPNAAGPSNTPASRAKKGSDRKLTWLMTEVINPSTKSKPPTAASLV
jgi:hypothetical protein